MLYDYVCFMLADTKVLPVVGKLSTYIVNFVRHATECKRQTLRHPCVLRCHVEKDSDCFIRVAQGISYNKRVWRSQYNHTHTQTKQSSHRLFPGFAKTRQGPRSYVCASRKMNVQERPKWDDGLRMTMRSSKETLLQSLLTGLERWLHAPKLQSFIDLLILNLKYIGLTRTWTLMTLLINHETPILTVINIYWSFINITSPNLGKSPWHPDPFNHLISQGEVHASLTGSIRINCCLCAQHLTASHHKRLGSSIP